MKLLLCYITNYVHWTLFNDKNEIIFQLSENSNNETDTANLLSSSYKKITKDINIKSISHLLYISGPGSFTAIRSSHSFIQGLSLTLQIPAAGIPTSELISIFPIYMPLRLVKARQMSAVEYKKNDYKVIKISNKKQTNNFEVCSDNWDTQKVICFKDSMLNWPQKEDLANLKLDNIDYDFNKIIYGFNPEFKQN